MDHLVPRPRRIAAGEGAAEWAGAITVVTEPGNTADRDAVDTLVEACRIRGLAEPEVVEIQDAAAIETDLLVLVGDPCRSWSLARAMHSDGLTMHPEAGDQGYVLLVEPNRILVAGNTRAGVYYGCQTLIQMLPERSASSIPAVRIDDWTDIRQRGVTMDLFSGEVYTMDAFRTNIRRLAHYKLNMLVLYLEDAFLFPSHPDIGEDRDRLTTAEVLELDAFARRHHVELVPCYDTPGHMGRTLGHPNYRHLAEMQEGERGRDVLNVTHPDAYPLIRDLYTDLCRAFPSRYHYMAGDEAFALGWGGSRDAARDVGVANLYLRHLKFVRDVLHEHGKRIAVAGDPFEPGFFKVFGIENYGLDALARVPRDVIIGPWHYGELEEYPFGDQLEAMGFDQYLWTSNASYYQLFPNQNQAAVNVQSVLPHAHRLKVLGTAHSDWNGFGENTFSEYNWPATAFYAEWAWTPDARDWDPLLRVAVESFYGAGTAGLAEVIRFLSDTERHFEWGRAGLLGPDFPLFFGPLKPRRLDETGLDQLDAFRRRRLELCAVYGNARGRASRNVAHLDYLGFALDQHAVLADLVECRHLLAGAANGDAGTADRSRLRDVLTALGAALPGLTERYAELWVRMDRPLGLEQNRKRFERLWAEVQAALGAE